MRLLSSPFILTLWVVSAYADGLISMSLERVLPKADIVVLAEIISNEVTITESKPKKGRHSATYTCNLRFKVAQEIESTAPKEASLSYQFTVIQGIWHEYNGSGLEQHMKAKEKYILLLTSHNDKLQLLRAEREAELDTIKKLIARLQKKEPDNSANAPDK
jgi:hypothetical protein